MCEYLTDPILQFSVFLDITVWAAYTWTDSHTFYVYYRELEKYIKDVKM